MEVFCFPPSDGVCPWGLFLVPTPPGEPPKLDFFLSGNRLGILIRIGVVRGTDLGEEKTGDRISVRGTVNNPPLRGSEQDRLLIY